MNQNETAEKEPDQPTEALTTAGAAEDAPKVPYDLKEVKDEPGSVKRYTVEVERSQFDAKLEEVLGDLNKTVVIEGFRRGKAPLRLLRNRFGKEVQDDAIRDMAGNIAAQLIEKDSLNVISEPELAESKVEENQPIQMQIDIDVQPKVDPQGYTGLDIEVESVIPTDEMVNRQLEMIRNANATYEAAAAEKAFEAGDGATVDTVVTDAEGNRKDNLCQENVFLREPQNTLPPEIAAEIIGKKAGDTITKEVVHSGRTSAGKEVSHTETYAVTIKEIKTKVLPTLDDEFAKDVGDFENLDALRKRIMDDLTQQQDRTKRSRAMDQIFDKALEAAPFEAPRKIVAAQEYQTIMRDTQRLRQLGLDFGAIGQSPEGYLQMARANSERLVKMNMLIRSIAEKEKMEVTDEDLEKEIERRAEESGRKPLAVRARLEAEKRLDSVKEELLLAKVEDYLMEKNNIKIIEPKTQPEASATEENK